MQPFQFYHVPGFDYGFQLINQSFTSVEYKCCDKSQFTHIKQSLSLAIVCPKILKIVPVDAYNASVIVKCLYTPIMLKIMPA